MATTNDIVDPTEKVENRHDCEKEIPEVEGQEDLFIEQIYFQETLIWLLFRIQHITTLRVVQNLIGKLE